MKLTCIIVALLAAPSLFGQEKELSVSRNLGAEPTFTNSMEAAIDSLFRQAYPAHSPGATVLIAKDDKILYRKAFGMANLELNVPMKPENVLQLASITKQFTSVSILILMEQGKLRLSDPLSKYLADFPRGNEITLHHLLNHCSGITNYTNLPEFRAKTRLDMTPEEIIRSFKDLPLEFNPGDQYAYSNSGYVLLGYIIEQLSGKSYADFVQEQIFGKLGMKNSYYAPVYSLVPNRANGYQLYEGNYEHPEYMSPTIPYAAGSLMSTVDDMFLWNQALHHNTLITEKSKQLAFMNHSLTTGTLSNYGYGWASNELAGCATLEHTGGINGYTTSGIYIPEKNIYAIVLTNLDDGKGPELYNLKAVSALLGKPVTENATVNLSEKQLKKWVGAYQFDDVTRFIIYEDGVLYSRREGGRPLQLIPLSENKFRFEGSLATYEFSSKKGKKYVLFTERISKSKGVESDKKLLSEQDFITLPEEILAAYVGVYELQPSFEIAVEWQNGNLFARATGQSPLQLFALSERVFYIRELDAQIIFNSDPDGTEKSLTFSQGENKMEGKKTK